MKVILIIYAVLWLWLLYSFYVMHKIEPNEKHSWIFYASVFIFAPLFFILSVGAIFYEWRKKKKEKALETNKTEANNERNQDMIKPKLDTRLEVITVGEQFTRHPLPFDGLDHLIPVITDYGIDVVMSFTNLSDNMR